MRGILKFEPKSRGQAMISVTALDDDGQPQGVPAQFILGNNEVTALRDQVNGYQSSRHDMEIEIVDLAVEDGADTAAKDKKVSGAKGADTVKAENGG